MGLICKVDSDGVQKWLVHGRLHRLDGPAIIRANGTRQWYLDDQRHRLDGPAVVFADGGQQWWRNNRDITQQVEAWMASQNVTWPWDDQTQMMFLLTWT